MNTKILTALAALAIITPLSALANSYDEKKDSSSSNFFNNDIFNDTYVSIGYGKSLPYGKLKGLALDEFAAEPEFYNKKKSSNSNIFKGSIGKKINNIRIEFETLYTAKQKFNFSAYSNALNNTLTYKLNTAHYTYFINSFYEFKKLHTFIKPYFGLGIGVSRNKVSSGKVNNLEGLNIFTAEKRNSTSFAWNASLGVIVDVNENLFLDFTYKYMDLGKVRGRPFKVMGDTSDNNNIKGRFRNNVFLVSAGFKF